MKLQDCGGCERRDACTQLFGRLFGTTPAGARRSEPRKSSAALHPFLALLGQVAKAIESGAPAKPAAAKAKGRAVGGVFAREVERRIESSLEQGPVRVDRLARELGLSRQTLYRRLKTEGATFEQLLDRVRRRVAQRLLREEGLSVKEVAYRLGFSDPAAFSRAFKRWTGTSPRDA
ncbi:MAG: helix-turn-helix transcriptional regulator [Pseudomonadota bacterium]|nr:helix-turn-helix transcriptional regulator [Pseudomonadota bacterium]